MGKNTGLVISIEGDYVSGGIDWEFVAISPAQRTRRVCERVCEVDWGKEGRGID